MRSRGRCLLHCSISRISSELTWEQTCKPIFVFPLMLVAEVYAFSRFLLCVPTQGLPVLFQSPQMQILAILRVYSCMTTSLQVPSLLPCFSSRPLVSSGVSSHSRVCAFFWCLSLVETLLFPSFILIYRQSSLALARTCLQVLCPLRLDL